MLRVALSIKEGKITPSTILKKLGTYSRKNKLYQAFRELGRVIRTAYLMKYIKDVELRSTIQAATNKSEAFNGFAKWIAFGNDGGIYFCANKANVTTYTGISVRNNRYNVTQFYDAKMNPTMTNSTEEILAGAQDNGTRRFTGAPLANNLYSDDYYDGGDGAFVEFDDNNLYKINSYVYNNH